MPLNDYLAKYSPDLYNQITQEEQEEEFINRVRKAGDRGLPKPHGVLGNFLDFVSRGNYGAAKAADVLVNEDGGILGKSWKALKGGIREIVSPEERLVFSDVIERANPVWAATHPAEKEIFGFMGDIVVDPINAISFGTGGVLKSAPKILGKGGKLIPLSKKGKVVFQRLAKQGAEEGLTGIRQREAATEVFQELIKPSKSRGIKGVSRESREVEERILKARISKTAESVSEQSGVFLSDYDTILKISEGKGSRTLLSPDEIADLKARIKQGDEVAEGIFDTIVQGSPKVEVSPLSSGPSVKTNIVRHGSKDSRQIGVIVPPRYINKRRFKRDKVGISRMFASSTLDPQDLRFVVPDSDRLLNFGQLQQHVSNRLSQEAAEKAARKARVKKGRDLLKESGISSDSLIDKGGFKVLGKTVIDGEGFKSFAKTIGLPEAWKAVEDLPPISQLRSVGKGLAETFALHRILERDRPEWVRFRRHIESMRHDSLQSLEKAFVDIFEVPTKGGGKRVLKTKEREEINQFLSQAQKATKDKIKELGLKNPSFEFGQKVFRDQLNGSNLSREQKAAVVKLQQAYNDMHRLEGQAGLVKSYFVNYNPQRYEAINSFKKYVELRQWQTGQPIRKGDSFSKTKKFASDEEALAAGYQPIRDAGQLYAMRFLEHHAALRKKEWKTFIDKTYPDGKIPREVDQDLLRLGEKYYQPRFGEAGRIFLELFDQINRTFRKSATVVRPAFTGKQIVGNSFQVFAEMGTDALRVLDPTILADAGILISGSGKKLQGFTDVFGVRYTGEELEALIKEFPVRKNVAIEDVGFATESDIVKRLSSDLFTVSKNKDGTTAMQGLEKAFMKGFMYLQIPAFTEDLFRIGAFLGALKTGNSPHAAIEIVDNALFNYTSGLSHAEQQIRRSVIPFFSFQKFGTELLTRTLGQHPARLGITAKGVREFFEVWNKINSGDTLTESERAVLPGYLLDQPHAFEEFDEFDPTGALKAEFRTFNNMMFLDVINFMQVNDRGEFDFKETLVRGALSQLMPFWKIPLEQAVFERELFTDRALEGVYAGRIGDIDYDKFVSNLATMAGLHGGALGGLAARGLSGLAKIGPAEDIIKKLIGWEEGVNPNTGERFVAINPYMLHVTTGLLPGMHTGLKLSRNDYTFWDKTLYTAFGIGTIRLDLEQQGVNRARSARFELLEKRKEYFKYLQEGRLNAADVARQDLTELLEYNEKEMDQWLDPSIRGGIGGQ